MGGVEVYEEGRPILGDADGVVCQYFCYGGLSRVFGAQYEDSGWFCDGALIVVGRRGAVKVAEGANAHLFECKVYICIGGHWCLV